MKLRKKKFEGWRVESEVMENGKGEGLKMKYSEDVDGDGIKLKIEEE